MRCDGRPWGVLAGTCVPVSPCPRVASRSPRPRSEAEGARPWGPMALESAVPWQMAPRVSHGSVASLGRWEGRGHSPLWRMGSTRSGQPGREWMLEGVGRRGQFGDQWQKVRGQLVQRDKGSVSPQCHILYVTEALRQ